MSLISQAGARGATILTVPGLNGSGPSHWQTLWERERPDTHRIDLGMWDRPHRNTWVTKLDQAIGRAQAPVILVAHSLGCIALAWWAALSPQPFGWPVAGALLVAPADVDRPGVPDTLADFAPAPRGALPFPSITVASQDDPWVELPRARSFASEWGSHFVDAGTLGHINAASGLGRWPEGLELLDRLLVAAGSSHSPGDARALLTARPPAAARAPGLLPGPL